VLKIIILSILRCQKIGRNKIGKNSELHLHYTHHSFQCTEPYHTAVGQYTDDNRLVVATEEPVALSQFGFAFYVASRGAAQRARRQDVVLQATRIDCAAKCARCKAN